MAISVKNISNANILDIGGATGDFLHYLNGLNPNLRYTGFDVVPTFLEIAEKECEFANFYKHDISKAGNTSTSEKYDYIFMSGVNYLFTCTFKIRKSGIVRRFCFLSMV